MRGPPARADEQDRYRGFPPCRVNQQQPGSVRCTQSPMHHAWAYPGRCVTRPRQPGMCLPSTRACLGTHAAGPRHVRGRQRRRAAPRRQPRRPVYLSGVPVVDGRGQGLAVAIGHARRGGRRTRLGIDGWVGCALRAQDLVGRPPLSPPVGHTVAHTSRIGCGRVDPRLHLCEPQCCLILIGQNPTSCKSTPEFFHHSGCCLVSLENLSCHPQKSKDNFRNTLVHD